MTEVTKITYQCDICKSEYKTPSLAHKCEKDCTIREELKSRSEEINHSVRLSLEDPAGIWEAIKEFAFKYYQWEIVWESTCAFSVPSIESFSTISGRNIVMIRSSHGCPIGKPRDYLGSSYTYPGWKFWIVGTIKGPNYITERELKERKGKKKYGEKPSVTALFSKTNYDFPYRIEGCHNGSFNGGENFSGEFYMFVDDFPKIKEKYEDLYPSDEMLKVLKRNW